jgi:hypothetical protein
MFHVPESAQDETHPISMYWDSDTVWQWIAWRLPRRLVYWCAIRIGTFEPRDLTTEEFARWDVVPDRRFADGVTFWARQK